MSETNGHAPMTLKSIEINRRASYEENAGKYTATIQYEGKRGATQVILDEKVSEALLAFIGPTITQFAAQAALEIERNIQFSVQQARQAPAIEAPAVSE